MTFVTKRKLMGILLLLFSSFVKAQSVKLVDFPKMPCKISKDALEKKIAACTDIDEAEKILIEQCVQPGNTINYSLVCRSCAGNKKLRFFPKGKFKNEGANFNSLSGKGSQEFYNLIQLKNYFRDTLATTEKIYLNLSKLSPADYQKAKTIYLKSHSTQKFFYPSLNLKEKTLVFEINTFSNSDNIFSVCYINSNNSEKILNEQLQLFLMSNSEKEELNKNVVVLRLADPSIKDEEIGAYLQALIQTTYSKIDPTALKKWIRLIKS